MHVQHACLTPGPELRRAHRARAFLLTSSTRHPPQASAMLLRALTALALCACTASAQPDEADFTPIASPRPTCPPTVELLPLTLSQPQVVPLAVRGPYLGAYLTGREDKTLVSMDPHYWTTLPLGWKGLLRVDGSTWNWMGNLTECEPLSDEPESARDLTSRLLHRARRSQRLDPAYGRRDGLHLDG